METQWKLVSFGFSKLCESYSDLRSRLLWVCPLAKTMPGPARHFAGRVACVARTSSPEFEGMKDSFQFCSSGTAGGTGFRLVPPPSPAVCGRKLSLFIGCVSALNPSASYTFGLCSMTMPGACSSCCMSPPLRPLLLARRSRDAQGEE